MGGRKSQRTEKEREGRAKKQWLMPLTCILGSIGLYIGLTLTDQGQGILSADRQIYREGYGGEEKEYPVWVEGLADEPVEVTVSVKPQIYTAFQAEETFEKIMEEMENRIRGENSSRSEERRVGKECL